MTMLKFSAVFIRPSRAPLVSQNSNSLRAKQRVVTAAHAVQQRPIHEVTINGVSRLVNEVIVHPGYKAAPKELKSGNAAPLMTFMESSDDFALIKLEHPVEDLTPAQMYRGADEERQTVEIIGRRATGNGLVDQYPNSPHRGELRRARSRVVSADPRWLGLRFEAPPRALPLEGIPADGDSGAPVLINVGWQVAIGWPGLQEICDRRPRRISLLPLRANNVSGSYISLHRMDRQCLLAGQLTSSEVARASPSSRMDSIFGSRPKRGAVWRRVWSSLADDFRTFLASAARPESLISRLA